MNGHHGAHGCCSGGKGHHGHHKAHGSGTCCGMQRRFITKAEQREALENYRDQLKKELTGVEERLQELSA